MTLLYNYLQLFFYYFLKIIIEYCVWDYLFHDRVASLMINQILCAKKFIFEFFRKRLSFWTTVPICLKLSFSLDRIMYYR